MNGPKHIIYALIIFIIYLIYLINSDEVYEPIANPNSDPNVDPNADPTKLKPYDSTNKLFEIISVPSVQQT